MSTATPTRTARNPTPAPHRLPRAPMSRAARVGEVLRGLGAALVLLAVLVGVPFALVELVGNPLPTTAPTRAWLDAELSAGAVLVVCVDLNVCAAFDQYLDRIAVIPGASV